MVDNITNLFRIDFYSQKTNKFLIGNQTLKSRTINKCTLFHPQDRKDFAIYKHLDLSFERLNFALINWLSLLQKQGGKNDNRKKENLFKMQGYL